MKLELKRPKIKLKNLHSEEYLNTFISYADSSFIFKHTASHLTRAHLQNDGIYFFYTDKKIKLPTLKVINIRPKGKLIFWLYDIKEVSETTNAILDGEPQFSLFPFPKEWQNETDYIYLIRVHSDLLCFTYSFLYHTKRNIILFSDLTHHFRTAKSTAIHFHEILKILKPLLPPFQKEKITILLGADPEFEISYYGDVIPACRVIKDINYNKPIGYDGEKNQVELRPKPAESPKQFIQNFQNLLKVFNEEYREYDLWAFPHNYPLGGHIHISIPPTDSLIKCLDLFLGAYTVHISKEIRGSYASLGNIEEKFYGFEYRTLPAIIFSHPKILKICLKIVKKIVKLHFKRKSLEIQFEKFKNGQKIANKQTFLKYKVLSEKEYEYFRWFCEEGWEKFKEVPLLAAWKIKRKREKRNLIEIAFSEDVFTERIKKLIKEKILKIKTETPIKITFFGLHKDRGKFVFAGYLEHKGFKQVQIATSSIYPEKAYLSLGLPYVFRTGEGDEKYERKIIRMIKKEIKFFIERVKKEV